MVLIIGNISVLSQNAIDSEGMEQIFHALFFIYFEGDTHLKKFKKKSQREMRDKQKN